MSNIYTLIPNSPTLSMILWVFIIVLTLYLGRHPAHQVIRSLFFMLYAGFRMASRSIATMANRMAIRNRDVLIEFGRESAERRLEREFMRLDSAVKRDLGNYPALHREILEKMSQLELDYRESTEEEPPNVEGWEKAIHAVSKIPTKGHTMVAEVLDDINDSFNNTHKQVLKDYRKINKERHKSLGLMIPTVRSMQKTMEQVDKNIKDLANRAREVSKYMDDYKEMLKKSDKAENRLASSALFQFFVSGLVLAIAGAGAFINFSIIERPMREMVSGGQYIQGIPVSSIAAMVIISIEIAMGLFLMELMRVTRLFPSISSLDDRMRKRLSWIAFIILFVMACVEASLGIIRDILSSQDAALINKETETVTETTSISAATNMTIGFILPFALVFIAIPLESFIHSALTALRTLGVILLRFVAFTVRGIGMFIKQIGITLVRVYDLVIIVPLWIEYLVSGKGESKQGKRRKSKVGAT